MAPDAGRSIEAIQAAIYNACWMVRHYRRGGRSSIGRAERQQAIHSLGLLLRDAFSSTEDFEPLITAILDGLRPSDEQPF